eukprot:15456630-Alexandrium_andersonii.AAC.1
MQHLPTPGAALFAVGRQGADLHLAQACELRPPRCEPRNRSLVIACHQPEPEVLRGRAEDGAAGLALGSKVRALVYPDARLSQALEAERNGASRGALHVVITFRA